MLYLIRLSGEVSTKAPKTRARFARRLESNLRDGLEAAGIEHRLVRRWSRLYLEAEGSQAAEVLRTTPGIQSFSASAVHRWEELGELVERGEEAFRDAVTGQTFAVRARRSGDRSRIPFTSTEVERELGAALLAHARGVDLSHPEVTVHVEVHPEEAYFFRHKEAAPGGLPLGVEGRALALVSGGFDSAVAAWLMLKRGLELDYLFFNLAGETAERDVLRVLAVLGRRWSHGSRPKLLAVDFRPLVAELKEKARPNLWQVLLKRRMLEAAERIAERRGLVALVTGESLGQVSSQTPHNLAVIGRRTALPILRPLVGLNKDEILDLARHIGTYEASAGVVEHCALLAKHPATRARLEPVEEELAKLDEAWLEAAVADSRVLDPRKLPTPDEAAAGVAADQLPAGAILLDLRSAAAFEAWHPEGALRVDFFDALERCRSFEPGRPYVVYCEEELKSAHLAEVMREAGLDAHHVVGGVGALRRHGLGDDPVARQLLAPAVLED